MKVKKWISYDEGESIEDSIGSIAVLGGFFKKGLRWKDYVERFDDSVVPYLEALKEEILDKELKYTGEDHQYGEYGTPVFEDGRVFLASMRAWGDLMAAVWSEELDTDMSYMDFYM